MSERPGARVPFFEHYLETDQEAHRVHLETWPFRIGRSGDAELTIHSRRVSMLHAEVSRGPDGHVIRDLGSTNGTFVNGEKVAEAAIEEGDIVHIAHKELRFGFADRDDEPQEPTLASDGEQQRLLRESNDLTRILTHRGVSAVFQPIVQLEDGRVVGCETLGRIALEGLDYSVGEVLRIAHARGQAPQLCRLFRDVAIEGLAMAEGPRSVFFNLHPQEMDDDDALTTALDQMASIAAAGHTAVLEIHESAVTRGGAMSSLHERLKERHIRLAYDDFGAGQSRLMELVEVPPDYLKLDMTLVRDIDRSARRQDLVRALVSVLTAQGIAVLAEGIERAEEAETCAQLGCSLGQGYHFGHPGPIV